jgi:tetratricopeptide (TPR) repeat protein
MFREILAARYEAMGQRDRAIELLQQVVEMRQKTDGPSHPRVARTRATLGFWLHRAGRAADAKREFQQAWEIVKDRTDVPFAGRADVASQLAAVSGPSDIPSDVELFEIALEIFRTEPQPRPIYVNTLLNYWMVLFRGDRNEQALRIAEELLPLAEQVFGPSALQTTQAQSAVARSLLRTGGDAARAEALARESLRQRREQFPAGSPHIHAVQIVLGEALLRQNRIDEARPLVQASADALLTMQPPPPDYLLRDSERLLNELGLPRAGPTSLPSTRQ